MQAGKLQSLRHAPYPALLWDEARRRVIWANAAAVAWFGAHGLAELVERPFDAREPGVRALARAAEALRVSADSSTPPQPLAMELHFPSTGQETPLKARISSCTLTDGRKALLVIARQAADVAARPRVLSEILGEMPQPVLALTTSGEPLFANPAALALLGEQGLLGEHAPFASEAALRTFLLRAREAGTAVETRKAHTGAGLRTLRLTARAAAQDDLVVVMIDDITDRLRAERGELPELCDVPDIALEAEEAPSASGEAAAATPSAPPATLRADELATLRRMMQALQEEDDSPLATDADDTPPAAPTSVSPPSASQEVPTTPASRPRDEELRDDAPRTETPQAETPRTPKRSRISIRVKKAIGPLTETDQPFADQAAERPAEQQAGQGTTHRLRQPGADGQPDAEPAVEPVDNTTRRATGNPAETDAEPLAEPAFDPSAAAAGDTSRDTTAATADIAAPEASGNTLHFSASRLPLSGDEQEADAASPATQAEPVEDATSTETEPPAALRQRPEPPQLVRDVLDHRPEPIILHRSEAFYFANRAARELLGHAQDDHAWDDIARTLASAHDGTEVRLPDAAGVLQRFTLKRDVFPWRAGVVVQSTLRPLGRVADADGAEQPAPSTSGPKSGKAAADGHATAGGEAATADTATSRPSISVPAAGRTKTSPHRQASRRAPAPVIRIHTEHGGKAASGDETPRASLTAATPVSTTPAAGSGAPAAPASAAPAPGSEEHARSSDEQPMDEELRAMLETAADGIITLNARGEILSFSSGAERLFGHAAMRVLGRPFRDLLAEESRPALDVRLARLRQDPAAARRRDEGREVLGLTASGKAIPLYLTIGVLQHTQPRDIEHRATFCAVVHDISTFKQRERELKQAKEQAEQRSARKSEFLARISHELRTPLNAILGFSDVLRQELFGQLGNEKYRDYARDIYNSGEHLLSLVNDLLDLARIEAGRYELDLKEVDLARIVEESVSIMREQAAAAGITLRRVVPDDLPRVVADARSIKQILLNLLSNAVKYARDGDAITITLRQRTDGGLELSVKDTGPGMSEDELHDALEPFRRVPRTGEDKPGTGLGLPLAKALAEANRARFEIASEPGKGTEARIIFPPHRVLV